MTNEFRFNQTNGELFKSSPSSLSSNLNKILCKEAKSQNFLVGSVGHQVSFFLFFIKNDKKDKDLIETSNASTNRNVKIG